MPITVRNQQRQHKIRATVLKRLAGKILQQLNSQMDIGIVLVDDAAITRLNREFHHTDNPTDVLAFDYGEGQAEIIISVERAVAQARRYRNTASRELALYVVHGLLHLHGYDDLKPTERRKMRAAERGMMTLLKAETPNLFFSE